MSYEIVERETLETKTQHVVITNEDGSQISFPAIEANPNYVAWLETADGKAYIASQKVSK